VINGRHLAAMYGDIPKADLSGEVLFEFVAIGAAVKVSAIHVPTNTEVIIMGSSAMSQFTLKANALRKLRAVLQRQRA
jgi:hypothetical protein